jgi:hypothetical protein
MKVDPTALKERMAKLSTEELASVLNVGRRAYNDEAIIAAREELESRERAQEALEETEVWREEKPEVDLDPTERWVPQKKAASLRWILLPAICILAAGLVSLLLVPRAESDAARLAGYAASIVLVLFATASILRHVRAVTQR